MTSLNVVHNTCRYDKAGCSYLYDIDAHLDTSRKRSWEGQHYVIDATARGNVSRFINHRYRPHADSVGSVAVIAAPT